MDEQQNNEIRKRSTLLPSTISSTSSEVPSWDPRCRQQTSSGIVIDSVSRSVVSIFGSSVPFWHPQSRKRRNSDDALQLIGNEEHSLLDSEEESDKYHQRSLLPKISGRDSRRERQNPLDLSNEMPQRGQGSTFRKNQMREAMQGPQELPHEVDMTVNSEWDSEECRLPTSRTIPHIRRIRSNSLSLSSICEELWESGEVLFSSKVTWLLLFGPVALIGDFTGWLSEFVCFCFACLALIPCAERYVPFAQFLIQSAI
jgi:hypothetical protein